MKKWFILTACVLTLSACSNTWHGAKSDVSHNTEKAEDRLERGWDKTKDTVKKGGQAVGKGISKTGDKLQEISE